MRQSQLKHNARLADARWEAKAKYIESPKAKAGTDQPQPSATEGRSMKPKPEAKEDPWAKSDETASNPGSQWQPQAWTPGPGKR